VAYTQQYLKTLTEQLANRICNAKDGVEYFSKPFQHIVIDNALSKDLADECLKNFPELNNPTWEHANDADIEIKYRTTWKSEFDIPEKIVDAVRILNSALFLNAMSLRMSIPKIVADPYFAGGGLNVTMRGGLLDVHVDGNYHDATGLNRRLNAILYLNPEWKEDWGGEFGVYDEEGKECVKRVPPLQNRLVIFDSHDFSFHGLPDPINFPEGIPRRSIILYYYTKESRPSSQIAVEQPHSALWVKRGLRDKRGSKVRQFT
jgi:Rps23 Pro-64 3,4-dihydroxylase Tpa1-like proline 4-hydroxylase